MGIIILYEFWRSSIEISREKYNLPKVFVLYFLNGQESCNQKNVRLQNISHHQSSFDGNCRARIRFTKFDCSSHNSVAILLALLNFWATWCIDQNQFVITNFGSFGYFIFLAFIVRTSIVNDGLLVSVCVIGTFAFALLMLGANLCATLRCQELMLSLLSVWTLTAHYIAICALIAMILYNLSTK